MSRPIINYIVEAAVRLFTPRRLGGILFDGSADIDLPGVNTPGNQSTTGNATTATRLQTARTINGTPFNGSANITTANWGISRNFTIAGATKSIDGSGNVIWTLAEMGAVPSSTQLIAGSGLTGGGTLAANRTLSVNYGTTAGTVAEGNDSRINNGQTAFSWGNHAEAGYLKGTGGGGTGGGVSVDDVPPLPADKITSGTLAADRIPNLNASKISAGTLAVDRVPALPASKITSGTLADARIPALSASKITSGTFDPARIPMLNQPTTGNASTATQLETARNFSITGDATASPVSFNGSANVGLALTLASITAAKTVGGAAKIPVVTVDVKGRITALSEVDIQLASQTKVKGGSEGTLVDGDIELRAGAGISITQVGRVITISLTQSYLPLTGGTITGNLTVNGETHSTAFFYND